MKLRIRVRLFSSLTILLVALLWPQTAQLISAQNGGLQFAVSFPESSNKEPLDGRLLLLISTDGATEPRFQISEDLTTQQVFGIDVDGLKPGQEAIVGANAFGYPVRSLAQVPSGEYTVQALLHRYETFKRSDGHTVKLPMDRGEGQQWSRAPGNLYSTPQKIKIDAQKPETIKILLDKVIPPIVPPKDTKYIKHVKMQSKLLSDFWGRPMYLGANILLPEGFDSHPNARYPLVIFHGHFPADFGGFRETPPDPTLKPDYSDRFKLEGYNKIVQEQAHKFYQEWTGPNFPRMIIIEIQHANPYYDDSYAVNSANLGPYGDAITYELVPFIEKQFRGIGKGWARFMYGGSTGGWEALAAQIFYPDEYNGAWGACPDPIDFRAYTVVNIYEHKNAYRADSKWKQTPRPGKRNYLGELAATIEEMNHMELALGTKSRSGGQFDIWEAVYSPVGAMVIPNRFGIRSPARLIHQSRRTGAKITIWATSSNATGASLDPSWRANFTSTWARPTTISSITLCIWSKIFSRPPKTRITAAKLIMNPAPNIAGMAITPGLTPSPASVIISSTLRRLSIAY